MTTVGFYVLQVSQKTGAWEGSRGSLKSTKSWSWIQNNYASFLAVIQNRFCSTDLPDLYFTWSDCMLRTASIAFVLLIPFLPSLLSYLQNLCAWYRICHVTFFELCGKSDFIILTIIFSQFGISSRLSTLLFSVCKRKIRKAFISLY